MTLKFNSMALLGSALASVMLCYTVSLKVSSERAAVETVRSRIAGDIRDIRMLQAELRTRSRLPELQRWNEQVLALVPPKVEQFLGAPVQLASFEAGAVPEALPQPATAMAAVGRGQAPSRMTEASPVRRVAYAPAALVPAAPLPAARTTASVRPTLDLALDNDLAGSIAAAAAQERAGFQKIALR